MIPQLAVCTTYKTLIVLAFWGGYMLPIPPFRGTISTTIELNVFRTFSELDIKPHQIQRGWLLGYKGRNPPFSPFNISPSGKVLPVSTVFLPEGQRVFGEKILFRRGASRVGDLDIALLNAVVSALARAAQWQQAQCRDLRFIVVLCVNSYPSWESTWESISHLGHLEGEQPQLGDLRSSWLLTTYKSWDDPPSKWTLENSIRFICL